MSSTSISRSNRPRSFPPVRACIFDMDGLILDSEDAYTKVTNTILREHGRPDLPWNIKAQLQGRPGPQAGKIFNAWAQLPISDEDFQKKQSELQKEAFKHCKPLPGVEALLQRLSGSRTTTPAGGSFPGHPTGRKVRMAVATSSHGRNFEIKTENWKDLFSVFPKHQVVVGDDPRIPKGRGKPLPDIYLLSLSIINEELRATGSLEPEIKPEECLVFEDSVTGVEAGRRAGMRVVWVPHPGLLEVYEHRVEEVLAGRTGEHKEEELEHSVGTPIDGSPGHVGEINDGWAELLATLEDFDYVKYGIDFSNAQYRTESGQDSTDGTTDRELEEMTAMADGKLHAVEVGISSPRLKSPIPAME